MKNVPRIGRTALVLSGSLLPIFGNCLPEDYFALSARNVSLSVADSILAAAVSPFLDALGLPDGSELDQGTDGEVDSGTP